MGALKGSITTRRYLVKGTVPTTDRIMAGIRAHHQLPIDPMTDTEKAIGWANAEDPSDCELSPPKVFKGDAVVVGLRVDTLKPPAAVVKRLVAEMLRDLDHRPSKSEKRAAKEEVVKKLRQRIYPTIKSHDMVWNTREGHVLFWSQSKNANEWLMAMFQKSFGLELEPLGPGLAVKGIPSLMPTQAMIMGFPGAPGRPAAFEDEQESDDE